MVIDAGYTAPCAGDASALEANLVVGLAKALTDDSLIEVSVGRYETFASSPILDHDYTEFGLALTFPDYIRIAFAYSPRATDHTRDDLKLSGPRRLVEISGQWPLSRRWSPTGGVGYNDLSKRRPA